MIACVRMPHFAVQVERLAAPALNHEAIVLLRYSGRKGTVYAACPQAFAEGVRPGLSASRARALCPDAQVLLAAPGRCRRAAESLLEQLSRYSQWLEVNRFKASGQLAVVYVDLGRLRAADGLALAADMHLLLRERHFPASIGLARNKFAACVAAASVPGGQTRLIPAGSEADTLAPYPVTLLPLGKERAHRLALLGLRTLGQLATLPRSALLAQFGTHGVLLHKLASGEDDRRVAHYVPERAASAAQDFDAPVEDRLILERVLCRMAGALATRLQAGHSTGSALTLALHLDDRTLVEESVRLRDPLDGAAAIHRRLCALLRRAVVRCGVVRLEVHVGALAPLLPRQLDLFGSASARDPQVLIRQVAARHEDAAFYTAAVAAALLPETLLSEMLLPEGRFSLTALHDLVEDEVA